MLLRDIWYRHFTILRLIKSRANIINALISLIYVRNK